MSFNYQYLKKDYGLTHGTFIWTIVQDMEFHTVAILLNNGLLNKGQVGVWERVYARIMVSVMVQWDYGSNMLSGKDLRKHNGLSKGLSKD